MKPLRFCDTCDEWVVANTDLNVGVCGHVDELIDPDEPALFAADVADYVSFGFEYCNRWRPRND